MGKKVIFFEVEGGTDKGPDGYRPDTMPMVDALQQRRTRSRGYFL